MAAAIASEHAGPVLMLVATPAKSHALYEELWLFAAGFPVARLPEREALPYEFARDDPSASVERSHALGLLRGTGRALVVALGRPLPSTAPDPK